MIGMPGKSHRGQLPPMTSAETEVSRNLERHVRELSVSIGERNVYRHEQLEAAALYAERSFMDLGYAPERQEYRVNDRTVCNIVAERTGRTHPEQILVVGGHYDTVEGTPGANDNATGVAATLEIARMMRSIECDRTIRFVAFVNEEPPFFQTEGMGSLVYARQCRKANESIIGMLSLETIGCYSDEKDSQHYPFPFNLIYPDTGNFIGFVGNVASRSLVRRTIGSFRKHTSFPSEGVAAPGWLTGIGWSDHWSFWQADYPALMVTDTALFRTTHYHQATDTAEKIDFDRMARVVVGLRRVIEDLSNAAN